MTPTAPPWTDAPELPGPEALPDRVDVAVIGGGIAGLSAACFLARGGADVAVLEAGSSVGAGASGRQTGLVPAGLLEHPWRLVQAIGADRAADIYRFSRENRALFADLAPVQASGSLWAASDEREVDEIDRSVRALRDLGHPVEAWTSERVGSTLSSAGLGPAIHFPDDVSVDPDAAVGAIARSAQDAGARLFVRSRVRAVHRHDDVAVHVGDRVIRAEVVVWAASTGLPDLAPWFGDKITPYREQALRIALPRPVPLPGRCGRGYTWWRPDASGGLVVAGRRWATPHLEVGETDDRVIVPGIQDMLGRFLEQHLPDLAGASVTHRWSWIHALTCDGLPIVGPIAGSARFVACTGFNGNELGLGVRAARAVADGLLEGHADGVPALFTPGRFL